MPIVSQLDGLRIKLPYDEYHEKIADVEVEGYRLGDISEIKRSKMYNNILLKILPESSII